MNTPAEVFESAPTPQRHASTTAGTLQKRRKTQVSFATELWQMRVRSRIKTARIIRRLECHVLAIPDPELDKDKVVELSPTQIRAAEILLAKTLPNLQSVEITHNSSYDKLTTEQLREMLRERLAAMPGLILDMLPNVQLAQDLSKEPESAIEQPDQVLDYDSK
ncbi:MAG: hypothetical protein ACYCOR_17925 [Acidobacteriaceae bacterium]